ncbi:M15 family metallopeptidase [Bacillus thermocopriae]|uniref:M15 family metallopeptidase n=1 Tax=Neobacillus thermocopriae TaxID=1215031 RepID=A0A6B3TLK7_9BACI|nr:M15 family metallopeptidase [Neobacillus thermocopriae]NEX77502.1 M15 family metallopeptidase [Neobacillus thermocopriae]
MVKKRSIILFLFFVLLLFSFSIGIGKILFSSEKENIQSQSSGSAGGQGINLSTRNEEEILVIDDPENIPVLVNKQHKLPESYRPDDLVEPDIPFLFDKKSSNRKMRAEAAAAIEKLFDEAKRQGVILQGVSAYRSYADQSALFQYYVKQDGYEAARTYSALPRMSEHETGLAIDVSGLDATCAVKDCFSGTKEAKWLEANAAKFGFIIRYPKGKESITGYKYEPWHLRYVGKTIAKEIMESGSTLEEYYNTLLVNN